MRLKEVGPYRIVALIASGGMGDVYHAERADGQYEQAVAVKLVRPAMASDGLLARFTSERQILASLEHANLAKLLDAGVTPEGLPYFVMELVRGEPIDAYCERACLTIEERLRLFRTVCSVVHYAHRKAVIHRDLKPSNVLVTEDGVVKLVDFGIAKRMDPGETAHTAATQRAMTLAYSSPEQVRGGELGPASDVYSLGVLLHHLLSGASPYPSTGNDGYALGKAICDTEPLAPSHALASTDAQTRSTRRRLRGDLDAVVLRALRKDPERRYASAEALSEDVFRHLEGLPVQARRGAWSYRTGRFVLRHRAVVGAAMLANLALLAGIALASYQTWQANEQRERAERHFSNVRRLANVMMFDVNKAIERLPGATSARQLIVQNALAYLRQLSAEARNDAALQIELAGGYRSIGDIQGGDARSNLGDPKGAMASYDSALALVQPLAAPARAGDPSYRDAQHELVVLFGRKGRLLQSLGRLKEAESAQAAGVAVALDTAAPDPANYRVQRLLANAYVNLAHVYTKAGNTQAFLDTSNLAAQQLQATLAQRPDDLQVVSSLAAIYGNRALHLLERDATRESASLALDETRKAMSVLQPAYDKAPLDTQLQYNYAVGHNNMGIALLRLQHAREAVGHQRRTVDILATMAAKDPSNADALDSQAQANVWLSESLLAAGDVNESLASATLAAKLFEALPRGALGLATTQDNLGAAHYRIGRALEARSALRAAAPSDRRADMQAACLHYRQSLGPLEERDKRLGVLPGKVGAAAVREALQRCT